MSLNAFHGAWAALMWPDSVVSAPLTGADGGGDPGRTGGVASTALAYRHVLYEAKAANAPVVTAHPHLYDPNTVAILPL